MPKYKVQLHPKSAPFTVNSREDLDFILAFYKRMRAAQAVAYPYFMYPQKFPSPERVKKGVGFPPLCAIVATDAEGENCKSCYRLNLVFALNYLRSVEISKARNKGEVKPEEVDYLGLGFVDTAKEDFIPNEAEAEKILSKINEYNALPEELPYTGAI